jgi:hypothetical protein
MKRNIRDKWIENLLSGKYEQGKQYLRNKNKANDGYKYCCLGVLYDILYPNEWGWNQRDKRITSQFLLERILEEVEMTDQQQCCLSEMNDRGDTFEEIAQWVGESL